MALATSLAGVPTTIYGQGNSPNSGNQRPAGPNDRQVNLDVHDGNPSQTPSGHDRNVERGGSYPQGNSGSNPDGGGVDKPFAAAGQPAQSQGAADFDGNNGCGNDNDFSDDNSGRCLGRLKQAEGPSGSTGATGSTGAPGPTGAVAGTATNDNNVGTGPTPDSGGAPNPAVAGVQVERGESSAEEAAAVAGVQVERGESGAEEAAAVAGIQVERSESSAEEAAVVAGVQVELVESSGEMEAAHVAGAVVESPYTLSGALPTVEVAGVQVSLDVLPATGGAPPMQIPMGFFVAIGMLGALLRVKMR